MAADDDEYRFHGDVYYEKQWDLLDAHLSPDDSRLVKRVLKRGEEKRGWAKNTVRNHMRNIRYIITYSYERDDIDDDITTWDADTWNELIDDLAIERDVGNGQKRAYASSAKAFIWFCRKTPEGLTRHDIDSPKQERPPIDEDTVLSHDEVMKLIENANNSRDRALIATIYQGGLRREAAVQINLKHYEDREDWATIRIPSVDGVKGADGHIKPLTWAKGYIDSWLNDHPEMQKDEPDMNEPLFCSVRKQDDGKRVSGHSVYTMLKRLADQLDIESDRIHPHALKHARATYMRASPRYDKKDIEQVMDWVESTPMHARYSHADQPAEAERVAAKMGVDVETSEQQSKDCPRCNGKVPPAVSYCPHCTLRLDDGPADWWRLYRRLVDDDDPVRSKYEELASTTPTFASLPPSELRHVRHHFGRAVAITDRRGSPYKGFSQDEIDQMARWWLDYGAVGSSMESHEAEWALMDDEEFDAEELREYAEQRRD